MTPRLTRRRWLYLIAFVVAAALVFALYPRRSLFPPLRDPNGYDTLARAAANVVRSEKPVKELTQDEFAALVTTNTAALLELRRGLDTPCAVPVVMSEQWMATQASNFVNLKCAAWGMDAEIRYRQRQGDVTGALDEACDLLRFGQAISRHGVWITAMVGTACEVMAVRCLTNLLPVLTGEQCKRAASRLELHEFQREPFDEITGREKEWQRKTFPLTVRLRENFKELVLGEKPLGQLFVPDVEKEYRTRTLEVRRFMLTAASRAFELDRGRRPQRASELVPDYLRAVPTDPASLAPIELRGGEHD